MAIPIVRAKRRARHWAAEHKEAFDDLLAKALNDPDLRVRVERDSIAGSLKRERDGGEPLIESGAKLLTTRKSASVLNGRAEFNEMLESRLRSASYLRTQEIRKSNRLAERASQAESSGRHRLRVMRSRESPRTTDVRTELLQLISYSRCGQQSQPRDKLF
jgi:hypothetical protein